MSSFIAAVVECSFHSHRSMFFPGVFSLFAVEKLAVCGYCKPCPQFSHIFHCADENMAQSLDLFYITHSVQSQGNMVKFTDFSIAK